MMSARTLDIATDAPVHTSSFFWPDTKSFEMPSTTNEPDRIPVSILTGFLGSGKTTLLSKLMHHPEMERIAVIVNEFGEVGLDDALVMEANEEVVLLNSGCLCCTVRGDLVDTLKTLFKDRAKSKIPNFDRIVIETTGLADPAPILHTMMADPFLADTISARRSHHRR